MKRPFLLAVILFLITTTVYAAEKKVLISKIVDHVALNSTIEGIKNAMEAGGYKEGENLILRTESAQGNTALASQIAIKFIHQKPDIVVGVGTVAAQSFAKFAREGKVKMVFSSISDPLGVGLVKSIDKPGNNSSGVSNFVPIEPQLRLFKKIKPELKKIGIVYNPGEGNSVSILKKIEEIAPAFNIEVVKKTATRTAEVAQSSISLAQNVDAIFISNDNTVLAALQSVIKAAQEANIPVFVSDTGAVELGAVAALGPNQYKVGQQTGEMIVRILNGADINLERVEFPNKTELYLNLAAAKKINLTISEELINSANILIVEDKK